MLVTPLWRHHPKNSRSKSQKFVRILFLQRQSSIYSDNKWHWTARIEWLCLTHADFLGFLSFFGYAIYLDSWKRQRNEYVNRLLHISLAYQYRTMIYVRTNKSNETFVFREILQSKHCHFNLKIKHKRRGKLWTAFRHAFRLCVQWSQVWCGNFISLINWRQSQLIGTDKVYVNPI